MNFSSQIRTNAWLNFSVISLVWLFNALCFVYCMATAIFLIKLLFIKAI